MSQLCYPLSASGSSLLPSPQPPAKLHIYFRTPKISPPLIFPLTAFFFKFPPFYGCVARGFFFFSPQITRIHTDFFSFWHADFADDADSFWRQLWQLWQFYPTHMNNCRKKICGICGICVTKKRKKSVRASPNSQMKSRQIPKWLRKNLANSLNINLFLKVLQIGVFPQITRIHTDFSFLSFVTQISLMTQIFLLLQFWNFSLHTWITEVIVIIVVRKNLRNLRNLRDK